MTDVVLFRSYCKACKYWAIHEIAVVEGLVEFACTNCDESATGRMPRSEAEKLVSLSERLARQHEAICPALRTLKQRSDHTVVPGWG